MWGRPRNVGEGRTSPRLASSARRRNELVRCAVKEALVRCCIRASLPLNSCATWAWSPAAGREGEETFLMWHALVRIGGGRLR
jgi:hypothetical protein